MESIPIYMASFVRNEFMNSTAFRARSVPRRFGVLMLALALSLFTLAAPAAAESASAPETRIVNELQEGLADILNNPPASAAARSDALSALVGQTFDINAMGAVAVGLDTYRGWTDEQRAGFLEAFARFMVATHASRFEDAQNPTFEIENSEEIQAGRMLVHARYLRAGHDPVAIDYLVRQTRDGWRVLDVYLDETVSLLALHRAEFASVLKSKGFDGFIAAMHAKADELTPG